MLLNGPENTEYLLLLKQDMQNEETWLKLANSQITYAAQVDVLERAVATIPSSLALMKKVIEIQITSGSVTSKTEQYVRDALSLFPDQMDLWNVLIQYFPSVFTFTFALRYVDNHRVWPEYYNFLLKNRDLSPQERTNGLLCYLEFDSSKLNDVLHKLLESGWQDIADQLLLKFQPSIYEWWTAAMANCKNFDVLRTACTLFPNHSAEILYYVVENLNLANEFKEIRGILLSNIESCCSVTSFISLFSLTCKLYERQISHLMQVQGQGGWDTTKLLTEYGNVLRKRSLYLNDAAMRENPQCVNLWLDRAQLWNTRPHIAADVLETALKTLNPLIARGPMDELYIEYIRLLVSNGSHGSVHKVFESAISIRCLTASQRCNLYCSFSDILQSFDPKGAEKVLEDALKSQMFIDKQLQKVWMLYLSILIENKSGKVLEAFSHACIEGTVTMRMCLMVAKSYPTGSSDQIAVFEKGVSMFPARMTLPLWKQFLVCIEKSTSLDMLRSLYNRALNDFEGHKREYEELSLLYFNAERSLTNGSLVFARKKLANILQTSTNPLIWKAYIFTLSDLNLRRQAYEQSLSKLDYKASYELALDFAALEESEGEMERAQRIYEFAEQLKNNLYPNSTKEFENDKFREVRFVPAMN